MLCWLTTIIAPFLARQWLTVLHFSDRIEAYRGSRGMATRKANLLWIVDQQLHVPSAGNRTYGVTCEGKPSNETNMPI